MPNHLAAQGDDADPEVACLWSYIPDNLLLMIFTQLKPQDLLQAAQVCKQWNRVALDELLWKSLLYRCWSVPPSVPRAPGKHSWLLEFKRLHYEIPLVESEVIAEHRDQVLHVTFSHNGKMFSSCSKDGYVKVWNATYPASLKYYADMKELTWKYTQFSQFNESDTLLLVSGVHFGSNSTSGEIVVFNLTGDKFELQCRVLNKPYDVFGTWFNNDYLLSGNIHWLGNYTSCSVLWLNKAEQALESQHESVVMCLYKFLNIKASSVRTIMVAECIDDSSHVCHRCLKPDSESQVTKSASVDMLDCRNGSEISIRGSNTECISKESGSVVSLGGDGLESGNSQIRKASEHVERSSDSFADLEQSVELEMSCKVCEINQESVSDSEDMPLEGTSKDNIVAADVYDQWYNNSRGMGPHGDMDPKSLIPCDPSNKVIHPSTSANSLLSNSSHYSNHSNPSSTENPTLTTSLSASQICCKCKSPLIHKPDPIRLRNKYLIFTMGTKTYTPHQIGIKLISAEEASQNIETMITRKEEEFFARASTHRERVESSDGDEAQEGAEPNGASADEDDMDTVDHLIELHGHIIGMCLSPNQRYLYVNSRPWPKDYVINDPLYPPPIAQEIDVHVIDLLTMEEVGMMHRAHKAYTPNDECFFIFLDVSAEYVASGAENCHGYLWDRHYGTCLAQYPHKDVVNCVAFNPIDQQVLITASDDNTLKIWRSRQRQRHLNHKTSDGKQ